MYFAPKYLASHPNFPNLCGECNRKFCLKKRSDCDDSEWSVRDGKVYLCNIAKNSERADCKYALCGDCAPMKNIHTPKIRIRRASSRMCGFI